MARTLESLGIVRYESAAGFRGKLLGTLTLIGHPTSISVWEPELHQRCVFLNQFRGVPLTYEVRPSQKWGDSLTAIESSKADHELYSILQERDIQANGVGVKRGSYLAEQVSKRVQTAIDTPESYDDVMKRVG